MTTGPVPTLTRGSIAVRPDGVQVPAATHWGRGGGGRFVPGKVKRVRPTIEVTKPSTGYYTARLGVGNLADVINNGDWTIELVSKGVIGRQIHFSGADYLHFTSVSSLRVRSTPSGVIDRTIPTIDYDNWNHIAISYDREAQTASTYVNGAIAHDNVAMNLDAWFNTMSLSVLNDVNLGSQGEVRVWNHRRSQTQILEYMNSRVQKDAPGLVSLNRLETIIPGSITVGQYGVGLTFQTKNEILGRPNAVWVPVPNSSYTPPTFEVIDDGPSLAGPALLIEEGTTNLLSEFQSRGTGAGAGWSSQASTIAFETDPQFPEGKVVAVTSLGEGTTPYHSIVGSLPVMTTLGAALTVSFWAKAGPSGLVSIICRDSIAATNWYLENISVTPGVWTKITRTVTPPAGQGLDRLYIRGAVIPPYTAVETTHFARVQVEQKPYATSWQPGGTARDTDMVWGNLSVGATGSVDFVFYDYGHITSNGTILAFWDKDGVGYYLYLRNHSGYYELIHNGTVMGRFSSTVGWRVLTITWTPTTLQAFMDGQAGSIVSAAINGLSRWVFGNRASPGTPNPPSGGARANILAQVLRVRNVVSSLAEHQALYNNGDFQMPERDANTVSLIHWDEADVAGVSDIPTAETLTQPATPKLSLQNVANIPSKETVGYPDLLTHGQFFADTFDGEDRPITEEGQWEIQESSGTVVSEVLDGALRIGSRVNGNYLRLKPMVPVQYRNVDLLTKIRPRPDLVDPFYGNLTFNLRSRDGYINAFPHNGLVLRAQYGGSLRLYDRINGVSNQIGVAGSSWTTAWRWIRFRAVGNRAFVKVWMDGESEPLAWNIVAPVDQADGEIFVAAYSSGTTPDISAFDIDEFYLADILTITDPGGIVSEQNIPDLSSLNLQAQDVGGLFEGVDPELKALYLSLVEAGDIAALSEMGIDHTMLGNIKSVGDILSGENVLWGDDKLARVEFGFPHGVKLLTENEV